MGVRGHHQGSPSILSKHNTYQWVDEVTDARLWACFPLLSRIAPGLIVGESVLAQTNASFPRNLSEPSQTASLEKVSNME